VSKYQGRSPERPWSFRRNFTALVRDLSRSIYKELFMSKPTLQTMRHILLSTCFIFPLFSSQVISQEVIQESIDPNVTEYKLTNGLTVILAPSKTAQSVALVTQYRVGSANEAPGRSGFAHLFEHLMFEGTKAAPDFDKLVSAVGGQNNAFTQKDTTTYFMTGPKEALPLFLRLDADRMANLANAVTQVDLDNQRAIVLNEMRQNVLDQPGGAAREQTETALYPPAHPYAHSPIGSIADLGAAKLEDVISFHRVNYVPANANVIVTGSFDVAQAKAWIEQTFALVPNTPKRELQKAIDVPANPFRLNFVDEVPTPVVTLQWPGPRGFSKQTVTNSLAAGAMSVGKNAIDNRLIVEQGVASSVGAYWSGGEQGGSFKVVATAAQGVSAEKLEAALRATLAIIRKEGFTEDTLKIVRKDIETGYASVPSNPVGFGIALSESAFNGDARTWRGEVEIANAINATDVSNALRTFKDADAQVSIITPGARNSNYPPVIANSTGISNAEQTIARADILIPEIALDKAAALIIPPSETRKLASGASLVLYKIEDSAKVGVSLTISGGTLDAPVGLADLAMATNSRGVGDLSLPAIDERYRASGVSINGGAGRHFSQVRGSAPSQNFELLVEEFAQAILQPRFDGKEWAAAIDQTVTAVEGARKSPGFFAMQKLRATLYPKGAPELIEPEIPALKLLKSEDAKALFAARMRPDTAVFHVASTLPIDKVAAAIDRAFASWTALPNTTPLKGYSIPKVTEGRFDSQVDGATQTTIVAALPAPDEGTPEAIAYGLAAQVLGGDSGSRLNTILREEKGWSYGIGASVNGERNRNNSLLLISTTVQADHTEDSVKEIRTILKDLATKPITSEELDTAKRITKAQFLDAFNSAPAMAGFASALYSQGYDLKDLTTYLDKVENVDLNQVNAAAKQIATSPMALSIAGDKALMK
jgi:zinc protease